MKEHVKVVVHFIDDTIVKGYVNNFNKKMVGRIGKEDF